jgi:hypothetical protein
MESPCKRTRHSDRSNDDPDASEPSASQSTEDDDSQPGTLSQASTSSVG